MAPYLSSCANTLYIYSLLTIVFQSDIQQAQPQIGLGEFKTCSLWFNEVRCWGKIEQITPNFGVNFPSIAYSNFGANFEAKKLLSGLAHDCLISTMGKVRCFGTNQWGQLGVEGTSPIPYGSVLSDVNLGEGFIVEDGDVGGQHSCFISTDKELKCFGRNHQGQLGYGDRDNRGDEKGEMGDNLLAVNFGADFEPKQVACGAASNCVLSSLLKIKCFGANANGNLGYGDTKNRGNTGGTDGKMGDNLDLVDLGDFTPIRLFAGASTACALSEEGTAKCWGSGKSGRLGMGNEDNIGDEPDEMGNNLPFMNFGTEFGSITDMHCGRNQVCGASDGGVKCYGSNYLAQLGQGDRDNRGGTPETVGDNLPFIDLGSDFDFAHFAVGGTHAYHICAVSTEKRFKCWGHNKFGQLGLDTNQALMGDRPSEMGDGLPYVDLPVNTPNPTVETTQGIVAQQQNGGGIQQNGGGFIVYFCGLLVMINMMCCVMYCCNKQYKVVGFDHSDIGNETDIDLNNIKCVE